MAYALADTARVEVERGNLEAAAAALAWSLPRSVAAGVRIIVPLLLEAAGSLAAARGEDELAVRLWSSATAERSSSGLRQHARRRAAPRRARGRVRARLEPRPGSPPPGQRADAHPGRGDDPPWSSRGGSAPDGHPDRRRPSRCSIGPHGIRQPTDAATATAARAASRDERPAATRTIEGIADEFRRHGYIAERSLATTVFLALELGRPLLLEGEAGVGKTELAKVLAASLGTRLIRLQCYEGLDVNTAVYEWNYPRQMLEIRLLEARGEIDTASAHDIFGAGVPAQAAAAPGARGGRDGARRSC